ncbi:GH12 family glycosyl hydrolase domain-containing protein [Paraburkholderia azotifigens]|uniref:Glycosyl hydrolase n=1 Tax=Paraburkholderia azotifigens TaxID=2057004 RepID=A0ABU9R9C2_9BURK
MARIPFLVACAVTASMLSAANAQTWTYSATSPETLSCDAKDLLFASWSYGHYTINNDVWSPCSGIPAGEQTIWANSNLDWGVSSNQPDTNGIKSYPHIGYAVNKTISSLNSLSAVVSASTPSGGAWESTFDIWAGNKAHEIMVWLNYTGTPDGCGNVKPISANWTSAGCAIPLQTNVPLSGGTWNVYVGTNGSNAVYSFLRTTKTDHTTVDVLAFMKYLKSRNYFDDAVIGEIQYGFEITSSPGGLRFASRNFTVTAE